MNKADLIDFIAEKMEVTKKEAGMFVDTFTEAVRTNIKKDEIKIAGFGSFSAKKRKARVGRNPQTGEEIKITARTVPVFKAGKTLKESSQKK